MFSWFRRKSDAHKPGADERSDRWKDAVKEVVRAMSSNEFTNADTAFDELVAITQTLDLTPSRESELIHEACRCENLADWEGAQNAYRGILEIPGITPFDEQRAHKCLCRLCEWLDREAEALEHGHLALAAARRADVSMQFAITADLVARCYLGIGKRLEARLVVEEALQQFSDDPIYDGMRASLLTIRAECALREHDLIAAGQDLSDAYAILGPKMNWANAPVGIQKDLLYWWAATAKLRSASFDREEAVTAWLEAVTRNRQVLAEWQDVFSNRLLAETLEQLAIALSKCGRDSEAYDATSESQKILGRIGLAKFGD